MTDLTRPIIGIENRTAQEVFDIMCYRFRRAAKLREGAEPVAVKYMVQRFLQWKLPVDFSPDGGIQFVKQTDYGHVFEPVGTNLLDYTQAKAMVLHMLDGAAIATTEQTDASGVRVRAIAEDAIKMCDDGHPVSAYNLAKMVLSALSPAAPDPSPVDDDISRVYEDHEPAAPEGRDDGDHWWHYKINYGPDGEENYANVYAPGGHFVGNLKIHHARAIVGGLNDAALSRPTERAVTEAMVDAALAEHERWDTGSSSRAGQPTEWHVIRKGDDGEWNHEASCETRAEQLALLERKAMFAALTAALAPEGK